MFALSQDFYQSLDDNLETGQIEFRDKVTLVSILSTDHKVC